MTNRSPPSRKTNPKTSQRFVDVDIVLGDGIEVEIQAHLVARAFAPTDGFVGGIVVGAGEVEFVAGSERNWGFEEESLLPVIVPTGDIDEATGFSAFDEIGAKLGAELVHVRHHAPDADTCGDVEGILGGFVFGLWGDIESKVGLKGELEFDFDGGFGEFEADTALIGFGGGEVGEVVVDLKNDTIPCLHGHPRIGGKVNDIGSGNPHAEQAALGQAVLVEECARRASPVLLGIFLFEGFGVVAVDAVDQDVVNHLFYARDKVESREFFVSGVCGDGGFCEKAMEVVRVLSARCMGGLHPDFGIDVSKCIFFGNKGSRVFGVAFEGSAVDPLRDGFDLIVAERDGVRKVGTVGAFGGHPRRHTAAVHRPLDQGSLGFGLFVGGEGEGADPARAVADLAVLLKDALHLAVVYGLSARIRGGFSGHLGRGFGGHLRRGFCGCVGWGGLRNGLRNGFRDGFRSFFRSGFGGGFGVSFCLGRGGNTGVKALPCERKADREGQTKCAERRAIHGFFLACGEVSVDGVI